MALTQFKPTTPGRRGLILVDRSDLHKGKPEKSLIEGLRKKGGRNNNGRITARRRGGGPCRGHAAFCCAARLGCFDVERQIIKKHSPSEWER